MEERLCIQKILEGESHHFAILVNRYQQMAFSLALSIVKHIPTAEDVVQESFISAYCNLNKFSFQSSFSTWLYTIVLRQSYKQCKPSKIVIHEVENIGDDTLHSFSDDEPILEKMAMEKKYLLLAQAIDALNEIEQVSIKLFYMEDKAITEIAEILDLSISNIKVILHRARKKLHTQLKHDFSKK